MPGIGEEIDGAMQQAPQPLRQESESIGGMSAEMIAVRRFYGIAGWSMPIREA